MEKIYIAKAMKICKKIKYITQPGIWKIEKETSLPQDQKSRDNMKNTVKHASQKNEDLNMFIFQ